jgi:HK97 family phage portal protein
MTIFDGIRNFFRPKITYIYGGDYGVNVANMDAAQLYRTQPNLRAVVSFLADNAAQIPIKVYERASDTDRPRVLDSPAALLLAKPNPDMTAYEFKRWMYSDMLLYERFLTLIVPSKATDSGWELRPIPAGWIQSYKGKSPFAPEAIVIGTGQGTGQIEVPANRFILFHGYDPTDPMRQYSRISALKETLHEQIESNGFRRQMWHRGGRFNAYLTRPKDVAQWSEPAFQRFKETWKASWAGGDAAEGGGMPILEDGMEIKTVQFNSKDAQWAESVKLSREDCAAVYHVNPGMIWPGSGQTYASARDNARALYNDCLAPTLMQATDRLNMVLLPRVGEPGNHYIAYDITIKTEGTYEEKIATLSSAVGAPFLSRNEARARLDLPAIEGGDDLITPLNVLTGGLASPRDTDPTIERYNSAPQHILKKSETRKSRGKPTEEEGEQIASVYRSFFKRQRDSVLPKLTAKTAKWWNEERWNKELAEDLYEKAFKLSVSTARETVKKLWDNGEYDPDRTEEFIRSMCRRRAEMVNQTTYKELLEALEAEEDDDGLKATPEGVFENAEENRADSAGFAFAGALISWSSMEACRQNERPGQNVFKTWVTTSGNPRASHAAMNGETVQYDEPFSNGAMWPGDIDNLDVEDVANCKCVLVIEVRD